MTLYTIVETSKMTGIKVRTLRDWIAKGKIKAIKLDEKTCKRGRQRWWQIPDWQVEKLIKG